MIEEMVAGLAARLAVAPDDLAGWQRLGRSYMVLQRFPAAAEAYAKAAELAPDNVDVLLAWAEALLPPVRAAGPPPADFEVLMARIVALDPGNARVLFMRGEAAARGGRPAEASAGVATSAGPSADGLAPAPAVGGPAGGVAGRRSVVTAAALILYLQVEG